MRKVGLILLISVLLGLYFLIGGEETPDQEVAPPTANLQDPGTVARDPGVDRAPSAPLPDYRQAQRPAYQPSPAPYAPYPSYGTYPDAPVGGYTFRPLDERQKKKMEEQRAASYPSTPDYPVSPGYQRSPEPYARPAPATDPYAARTPYTDPYAARSPAPDPYAAQRPHEAPYAMQAPALDPYASQQPYDDPYAMQAPPPSSYTRPAPVAKPRFRFRPYDERRETKRWTENYAPPEEQYMPYTPQQAPSPYYSPARDPSRRNRADGPFSRNRPLWAANGWDY